MATINREGYKEEVRINVFWYITKPFEEEKIMEALEIKNGFVKTVEAD